MQSKTFNLFETILNILAQNYNKSFSLEDLTAKLSCISNDLYSNGELIAKKRENQAQVLEALIRLNDIGLIFLDSSNDKSFITLRGLIIANSEFFYN